jgi:hypothetical protein
MARRARTAEAADTDPHGTGKPIPPEGATTVPQAPYPGIYPGHPDATYCPDCGRIALGDMVHGDHAKGKK